VRIKAEVDPILEITEISSRVIKERGPALIFENVRGAAYPLAINLFGTEERVELALGRRPRDVGEELVELFHKVNPPSLKSFFSVLPRRTISCPWDEGRKSGRLRRWRSATSRGCRS
jgi:UbiD family decarboxylase